LGTWLFGELAGWLVAWLVACLCDGGFIDAGWLTRWVTDWLSGGLTAWLPLAVEQLEELPSCLAA
jgi:hypothetical protein